MKRQIDLRPLLRRDKKPASKRRTWQLYLDASTRVKVGIAIGGLWVLPSQRCSLKVIGEVLIRKASPKRRVKILLVLRPALQSVPMWSGLQPGSEEFHDLPVFAYRGFDEGLPPPSIRP